MGGSKTFNYRISKDKSLAMYIGSRVLYDDGVNSSWLEGVMRVPDEGLLTDRAVHIEVVCEYVFIEDDSLEVLKQVAYSKNIILHPNPAQNFSPNSAQRALIRKVGPVCFPFVMEVPVGLPASVCLKQATYFEGREVGVTWSLRSYFTSPLNSSKTSNVGITFRKVNSILPRPEFIPPPITGKKTFMFDSSAPLQLAVQLQKDVYVCGDPIDVTVKVANDSKKEVHAIKISAKQICETRFGSVTTRFKSQVALLESSNGCPVKRGNKFTHTYSITPKILPQEAHHVAQEIKLNLADPSVLAASSRTSSENPNELYGVTISYYLNVHAVVNLGSDLIVRVPFTLSFPPPASSSKSKSPPSEPKVEDSMDVAADKLARQLTSPPIDEDLLIDLDDAPATLHPPLSVSGGASPLSSRPVSSLMQSTSTYSNAPPSSFAALKTTTSDPVPVEVHITTAIRMLDDCALILRKTQSSVASTQSTRLIATSTLSEVLATAKRVGQQLQRLLEELSHINPSVRSLLFDSEICSLTIEFAQGIQLLAEKAVNCSWLTTDTAAQLRMLQAVNDIVEKSKMLVQGVSQVLQQPSERMMLDNLAEYLSQALPAIGNHLPGQRECKAAIDTLATARSSLLEPIEPPTDAVTVATIVDDLHRRAANLSAAFKQLGVACNTPENTDGIAAAVAAYREAVPSVLSAGRVLSARMTDQSDRNTLLAQLATICSFSIDLVKVAKELQGTTKVAEALTSLQTTAANVVASMRVLLLSTLQFKAKEDARLLLEQQQQLKAQASSSTSPAPALSVSRDGDASFVLAPSNPFASMVSGQSPSAPSSERVSQSISTSTSTSTSGPSTSTSTVVTAPVIASSSAPPTSLERDHSSTGFDSYIVKPTEETPVDTAPSTKTSHIDKTIAELQLVINRVGLTRKALIDACTKPRRMSVIAEQPVVPGKATVLAAVGPIINAVSNLIEQSLNRVKESRILQSHGEVTEANFDSLVTTSADLAKATSALVHTADEMSQGDESVHALMERIHAVTETAGRHVEASNVRRDCNSNNQSEVDSAYRVLTESASALEEAAAKALREAQPPVGSLKHGVSQEDITKQTQILKLEEDLEKKEQTSFQIRRGSLWSEV